MAGDWIKMRMGLQSHPKVVRILSATGADKFRVVGGLHAVWCVFDEHSSDGFLKGYTPDLLDHVIGWVGFSRAMEAVGWLLFDGLETLSLPEFTTHNGKSAKRRAEDTQRKNDARNSPQNVRKESAQTEDKKRTREEKRREEKEHTSTASRFGEFWSVYPRRDNRAAAEKRWGTIKADKDAEQIIADVKRRLSDPDQWTDVKYIPHGATYLNQRRWEDEPSAQINGHDPDDEVAALMRGGI